MFQAEPQSLDGTLQSGGVGLVKSESLSFQELASFDSFALSLFTQRTIVPSSELIFIVPSGFTVTNQNQGVLHAKLRVGGRAGRGANLVPVAVATQNREQKKILVSTLIKHPLFLCKRNDSYHLPNSISQKGVLAGECRSCGRQGDKAEKGKGKIHLDQLILF